MAADTGNQVNSIQISGGNISDKKEVIVCDCCEKVKLELEDVKLEISSIREIIRVFQEEISGISPPKQPTEKENETHEADESYAVSANREWTNISSNRRNKIPNTRNSRQLPLVTPNKFATVTNLDNENQFPECVPQMRRPNPRNDYHEEHRPPYLRVSKINHANQQIVIVGDSHARKSSAELK